jgi:hypothetical protein
MHWKRYEKLLSQLRAAEDRYYGALGGWLEQLKRKRAEALENLRQGQNTETSV